MPETSTGVSVVGEQRCGRFNETLDPWQLRFASNPQLNRNARLGTAVIALPITNQRYPVVYTVPVYGGGIAPKFASGYPANVLELWVFWYSAGYLWFFERPALGE